METRDPSERAKRGFVNLTIVGGRPSEDESRSRGTPRGLEVLLKKASVDAEFCVLLLEQRSRASESIGLELDPAEATMLDHMPAEQLEAIIRRTRVREEDRRVFLGKAASVMLAALGAGVGGCTKKNTPPKTAGISPDRIKKASPESGSTRSASS
jgi:hypothetical protein